MKKLTPKRRFKGFADPWEQRKLGELCSIKTGRLDANSASVDGEYPFFTCSKETFQVDSFAFDGDAIIINGNGDLGFTRKYSGRFDAYQRTYVLMDFTDDFDYIEAAIQKYLPVSIAREAIGGAMPYIKLETLSKQVLSLPNPAEQVAISGFFDNLSNLITLHQCKLEKLKVLKTAYLYQMFPQEGESIPELRFQGFTDPWEQRKLYEIAEFNPTAELPNVFEYVDLESVVGTEMISHRTETKAASPSRAQRLARTGDVFYQTVRPYQKNNYLFSKTDKDYVFSTGYAQMRPNIDTAFLMSFLQTDNFVKVVLDHCTGTSYPAINSTDLSNLEITLPSSRDEQKKIGSFFSDIDNLITLHQCKFKKLKALKQAYLSEMFV